MIVINQLAEQLQLLSNVLQQLNNEQYVYKSRYLANASIGGHTRHIIELLQCAINGHSRGFIDYINRKRNLVLENNVAYAIDAMNDLLVNVDLNDKTIGLFCEDGTSITTTYYRELVYNVEHIIHHLALIKVSLIEMELGIVNENFGMAYSTIQYKNQLQKA